MNKKAKYITVMLIPDGTEARLAWRLRQWLLYVLAGSITFLVVGILLFFAFYGKMVSRATMTEQVMKDNQDLLRYRYKVQLLEDNLAEAREFVDRLAALAGVDYEFPALPDDSTLFASLDDGHSAVLSRTLNRDWSLPSGLPVKGFVTQDYELENADRYHPGVDIACAVGTPVLATGAGQVLTVAFDSTYGNILVVRHNDSVTTVYGHNDTVLVRPGQQVLAGSRIALAGNTGVSTAPHLHYEVRINDKPINPLDSPYDKENH